MAFRRKMYDQTLEALRSRPRETQTIRLLLASDGTQDEEVVDALNRHETVQYEVEPIRSSADCLQALARDHFDVLLLDDSLPDSGRTLLRQLAEGTAVPPVVMLVAAMGDGAAAKEIERGAHYSILKGSADYLRLGQAVHELLLRRHRQEEERRAQAELDRLTVIDGLTGLGCGRYLNGLLESECRRARRYGSNLSLLMLDLDDFRDYNDLYGKRMGDLILKQVAVLIRQAVRDTDSVTRRGGDRFAVLAPETDYDGAMQGAERLRLAVAANGRTVGKRLEPMTVSVGVYTPTTMEELSPDVIVGGAESALQIAKASGKNRVCGRGAAVADPEPGLRVSG